jgi:hypothetical protein
MFRSLTTPFRVRCCLVLEASFFAILPARAQLTAPFTSDYTISADTFASDSRYAIAGTNYSGKADLQSSVIEAVSRTPRLTLANTTGLTVPVFSPTFIEVDWRTAHQYAGTLLHSMGSANGESDVNFQLAYSFAQDTPYSFSFELTHPNGPTDLPNGFVGSEGTVFFTFRNGLQGYTSGFLDFTAADFSYQTNAIAPANSTWAVQISITLKSALGVTNAPVAPLSLTSGFALKLATAPRLMGLLRPSQFSLSWTSFFPGYSLQYSTDFTNPLGWFPVAEAVTVSNSMNVVTLPRSQGSWFYRLRK